MIALATIALTTTTDVDFGQNHLREAQREFTQRSTDREREETSKEVLKEKSSKQRFCKGRRTRHFCFLYLKEIEREKEVQQR